MFARLNVKAGGLKLGPKGHIKYQNEEITNVSIIIDQIFYEYVKNLVQK